jgi:hypothetical protein
MRTSALTAPGRPGAARRLLAGTVSTALATVAMVGIAAPSASAATVTSTAWSGTNNTAVVGDVLYAKSGGRVTLTVKTTSDTRCVQITGAHTGRQTASGPTSSWSFTFVAGTAEGVRALTVAASPSFTSTGCAGTSGSGQATYVVDNTGPVSTPTISPAPNAAGWNNTETTIAWTATDAGAGVPAQPYETDLVTTDGVQVVSTSGGTDLLGNIGPGASTTVRVDRTAPVVTAVKRWAADGSGITVIFGCADPGAEASGIATCRADGSSTNAITVAEGETVSGTATDVAGNTGTSTVDTTDVDTTPPVLSGSPLTAPEGGQGWYRDDVTVRWTASDPESGVLETPADTLITGEGVGLTSSATVTNGAGLSTTATSAPAVRIDRTPPATTLSGAPEGWAGQSVTVTLAATDALSGVASTSYRIDGGPLQSGSDVVLTEDGDHTVAFSSTDLAGNAEAPQTARVRIDRTAPTIGHLFTPDAYENGAWTSAQTVTVTFVCEDRGGSGLASCTAPVTVTDEGVRVVDGTATDGAGNRASDRATVRIDRTAPEVEGTVVGVRNEAGWYSGDVTVTWTATDALSGVAGVSPATALTEGRGQTATGSATDAAGNRGTGRVEGLDVDLTDPALAAAFADGWATGDVPVDWSCSDALSGVATGPADVLVTGEGGDLTATASCTDVAGNAATETVHGIRIDRTPPVTRAVAEGSSEAGWFAGTAEVTLKATDNLSGVRSTTYTVDGGAPQPYAGAFAVTGDGEHTVSFWSADVAGNVEPAAAPLVVRIDDRAPVTELVDPGTGDGWIVTSGVPFAFRATDGAGSGLAATYYSVDGGAPQLYGEPFTANLATGQHTVRYWSVDVAGNVEDARSFTVRIDTEGPVVVARVVDGAAGRAGWYVGPVTVDFTCTDALSGVATCPAPQSFDTDGVHAASGTATDNAGNRATATLSGIRIDTTAPTVRFSATLGTAGAGSVPVAPTCTAVDTGSGPGSCVVTGYSTAVGTHMLIATATDVAGNTGTAKQTYTVTPATLTIRGFYSPIDMDELNVVKAGSTVPVKFELFDGKKELSSIGDVTSVTSRQVSCTTGTAFAPERAIASTGGTALRWSGQYIQNWKVPTALGCYRLTMTARDGSSITAQFKVK